jgi:hypothetical protein
MFYCVNIRPVSKVSVDFRVIDFRVGSGVNHDIRPDQVKNLVNRRLLTNI